VYELGERGLNELINRGLVPKRYAPRSERTPLKHTRKLCIRAASVKLLLHEVIVDLGYFAACISSCGVTLTFVSAIHLNADMTEAATDAIRAFEQEAWRAVKTELRLFQLIRGSSTLAVRSATFGAGMRCANRITVGWITPHELMQGSEVAEIDNNLVVVRV